MVYRGRACLHGCDDCEREEKGLRPSPKNVHTETFVMMIILLFMTVGFFVGYGTGIAAERDHRQNNVISP